MVPKKIKLKSKVTMSENRIFGDEVLKEAFIKRCELSKNQLIFSNINKQIEDQKYETNLLERIERLEQIIFDLNFHSNNSIIKKPTDEEIKKYSKSTIKLNKIG